MGGCYNDNEFGVRRLKMDKKSRKRRMLYRRQAKKLDDSLSLKELQALAHANEISIFRRRKDDMGFTKQPLPKAALKARLTRMKVSYKPSSRMSGSIMDTSVPAGLPPAAMFGASTVCRPGYATNPRWAKTGKGRQCTKVKPVKKTLKQLQALARANEVSIYHRRKDDMGFTKKPLSMRGLKNRLARMKVSYFGRNNHKTYKDNRMLINSDSPNPIRHLFYM
jgi:hypothetical protein